MGNRISDEKYEDALAFLYAQLPMFSRVGAAAYKPGLERVEKLSRFFNNPEKKLKAIHIAGTNGKGSTSHLIASVLQSAGFKTALYTSPHLVDFRERMKINGEMIPKERVIDFVEKWKTCKYTGDKPSFFELTMMMAFDWFASENVDYAVIETGMGGRLDSTNIISPLLSVITNISPDHTQFLGSTLKEIATEKAGIIKKGVPVVIGEAEGEVEQVFRFHASDKGASLTESY
ncbi:MAG: bifunctional folylpolyglutamate synthase/dihydrofolate synthase, partial [Muribaculaceae bacterium]|nr:bifunctional folylpolyglutamate synthase/dihydrofolate synthase [Muribaculaceae bacterium]